MFYFVIKTGEVYEQKQQVKLIKLKNAMLQKSLDETEQTFRLWRNSVHDYKNNIIVLRQLCEDGNIDEITKYLTRESELINKKMFYIHTGNSSVDAIVNIKQNIAEKKGIVFMINASIPQKCYIREMDIAGILGNLIDNAIEACEGESEPYIDITIRQEKSFVIIKIVNKFSRKISKKLETTKHKKIFHGVGILTAGMYFGDITSKAQVAVKNENNHIETEDVDEIIPNETIEADNTDNLYVELNNKLIEAMDDYSKGKIDEEEYLDICKSVNKQIDSKSEYKELKKSESEFKSEK